MQFVYRLLEKLKKIQESVATTSANSRDPILLEEDKITRIKQNLLLCEYYQQQGQFPQKYLYELQKLAIQAMNVTLDAAPKCQISPDGSHIMLGDWTNQPGLAHDTRKSF